MTTIDLPPLSKTDAATILTRLTRALAEPAARARAALTEALDSADAHRRLLSLSDRALDDIGMAGAGAAAKHEDAVRAAIRSARAQCGAGAV